MPLSYKEMITKIETSLNILEKEYSINKNCRFYKAYNNYKNINKLKEEQIISRQLIEGINDLYQLTCITECSELLNTEMCRNEINKIFGGADLPDNDTNKISRNIQYQLYIMSLFYKAFKTYIEEPDFSIIFINKKHYVAVKRVSSEKMILNQIKNEQTQIKNCKGIGIIVIGLDLLLLDSYKKTKEDPFMFLSNYIRNKNNSIKDIIDVEIVKAILFTFNFPIFDSITKTYGYSSNSLFWAANDTKTYGEKITKIFCKY